MNQAGTGLARWYLRMIAPTIITYTAGTTPFSNNNAGSDRLKFPSGATTTITGSFATSLNALMAQDTTIPFTCEVRSAAISA